MKYIIGYWILWQLISFQIGLLMYAFYNFYRVVKDGLDWKVEKVKG